MYYPQLKWGYWTIHYAKLFWNFPALYLFLLLYNNNIHIKRIMVYSTSILHNNSNIIKGINRGKRLNISKIYIAYRG